MDVKEEKRKTAEQLAIDTADKIRNIIHSSDFKETLGKWMKEFQAEAMRTAATAEDDKEVFRAIGRWQAIDHLRLNIKHFLDKADSIKQKQNERQLKRMNNDRTG